MAREDRIEMSQKDLKRCHIVQRVFEGGLKQLEAGQLLGITPRQVRRIMHRVKAEGQKGVIHKLRGNPSNHRCPAPLHKEILKLYQKNYPDFGPTLASEKLWERHKLKSHPETLRLWLIKAGIPYLQRKKRPHRQWRPRKASFGEMIQMDGSHHDWLEGRGPWLVLMAYKDDATGEVFARFYDYEGTSPAMASFKCYVLKYGLPHSIYFDKHPTYKGFAELSIEQQLQGQKSLSQFQRALKELDVQFIHAHSPQAKGRIERQFRTFQNRLVKELRLENAKTINEANCVLQKYLPSYNKQFNVPPQNPTNLHRAAPTRFVLEDILCRKEKRVLRNDFTVSYQGRFYQILDRIRAQIIDIHEKTNGTLTFTHHNQKLRFRQILSRPVKTMPVIPKISTAISMRRRVAPNHPWKKTFSTNAQAA